MPRVIEQVGEELGVKLPLFLSFLPFFLTGKDDPLYPLNSGVLRFPEEK